MTKRDEAAELRNLEEHRVPATMTTESLTILDARGGEIRWESERFRQEQDPESARLSELADRYLKHMEDE